MSEAQADLESKLELAEKTRIEADAAKGGLLQALKEAHSAVASAEGASAQVQQHLRAAAASSAEGVVEAVGGTTAHSVSGGEMDVLADESDVAGGSEEASLAQIRVGSISGEVPSVDNLPRPRGSGDSDSNKSAPEKPN